MNLRVFNQWRCTLKPCSALALFLLSFCSQSIVSGQTQNVIVFPPRPPKALAGKAVLPPDTTSDPAAQKALKEVIVYTGGESAWQHVKSSEVHFRVGSGDSAKDFLLTDDWHTGNTKYLRGIKGQSNSPKDHDSSSQRSFQGGDAPANIAELDQARVIATHLPSVAAQIVLQNENYLVREEAASQCEASARQCVDIYWHRKSGDPYVLEQLWTISTETHLPLSVSLRPPSFSQSTSISWRKYDFSDWQGIQGLKIPSVVYAGPPGFPAQKQVLISFTPNAEYNKTKFEEELK
ncbi:hypothetical protein [Terriglobus albidus]|uniref:hypothetical protein n=1 Tax=Terriglobus albidus TaxID=1592106 RepID=UPI0021E0AE85|nr:hypothetical protein [Terriglobus albidus]